MIKVWKKVRGYIMKKLEASRRRKIERLTYQRVFWTEYDYSQLKVIPKKSLRGNGEKNTYNDVICMIDTETSKKPGVEKIVQNNHVVVWSLAMMSYDHLICCLWGDDPEDFIKCIDKIKKQLPGHYFYLYVHNLSYDYVFLRKFMFKAWSFPKKALNTKPHYPIRIEFENGIQLRDSLILAQRSLDKWGRDLDVEHKKAVGQWDYDKIRNQHAKDIYTEDEIEYFCNDVICGVECINKTMRTLNKNISSMPYTATGIPREEVRELAKQNRGHDRFLRRESGYEVLKLLEDCFHGGYTHANRHLLDETIKGDIKCYDFSSSYPFVMLSEKFPMEKFTPIELTPEEILKESHNYAFIFYLVLYKPILKSDDIVMPFIQNSKCRRTLEAVVDNGRILQADLVIIPVTELDFKIIQSQYDYDDIKISDCYFAVKDYLPKWFRDYIYSLYKDKCELKVRDPFDPVLYAIQKAKLNSLYGMCAQHVLHDDIIEDYGTGDYETKRPEDPVAEYEKYLKRFGSVLNYMWGVYVTAYAAFNLISLGNDALSGEDSEWIYSDTDSFYGIGFDEDVIKQYNKNCEKKLKASGYSPVYVNDKKYVLGIAEFDGEYTEFRTCGAKRYACRDTEGKLKITVAGVPKKRGVLCLNDDINNFRPGLIFDGKTTGKLLHTYCYVDDIYTDENGNKTGDSIDLSPCDYLLDSESDFNFDDLLTEYIEVQTYGEE